jgi:hypothetical protein
LSRDLWLAANLGFLHLRLLKAEAEPHRQLHGNLGRTERLLLRLSLKLSVFFGAAAVLFRFTRLVPAMGAKSP